MKNFRKNGKKGFTLAELLIVVAIIAVLTAIAVPLFVGALNDAEDNVKAASMRAVRAEAVNEILLNKNKGTAGKDLMYEGGTKADDKDAKFWEVTAFVSTSGEIKAINIVPKTTDTSSTFITEADEDGYHKLTKTEAETAVKTYTTVKEGDYQIKLVIALPEVTSK